MSHSKMMQQFLGLLYVLFLTEWMNTAYARRSVRRLCKNEIDLMSDEGVRIEPVERSHVELQLADQNVRNRNAIRFEFRTNAENGILFYGRSQAVPWELVALRLLSGDLHYKIHCSTLSADVLFPHSQKLNDGKWHTVVVRYRRGGLKTQIEVDGIRDTKTYEVSCDRMTSLVFGGVSPHDRNLVYERLGKVPHYDGCIRRVSIPTALRSPPKYYAISICEH
ncbi:sex hormone-binding globulin-like [Littorina saxatilis]|uniref:Laminin G domain-containing protein n=1 Tax=Littorina saxatilis TaxID=31220 RepID=A0AAN9BX77_9CAEN